jgi:hypothetical protein
LLGSPTSTARPVTAPPRSRIGPWAARSTSSSTTRSPIASRSVCDTSNVDPSKPSGQPIAVRTVSVALSVDSSP